MEEANIVGWRKQLGQEVLKDEILFEMETDKVIVEVPAPASGTLLRIDVAEGVAKLDVPVCWIGTSGEPIPDSSSAPKIAKPSPVPPAVSTLAPGPTAATPAARRRAREVGVDLASVRGTGPGGRITEADVDSARAQA
jgi:pyruvate/2-oxoglutarate dehydrogenase complex dihydrolipoamide acyltransferase (E2) component